MAMTKQIYIFQICKKKILSYYVMLHSRNTISLKIKVQMPSYSLSYI